MGCMTEERRIRDLEQEVVRLRRALAQTRGATSDPGPQQPRQPQQQRAPARPAAPHPPEAERRAVAEADAGTGFSRGTVVFLMTVMAIGGVLAFSNRGGGPEPWHGVAAGYAIALGCVTLGWFSRERGHPVAHLLLGGGLAAFYLATYAACLSEQLGPFADLRLRWPVLMGALALLLGAVHLRAAGGAAGIGLIAVYCTAAHAATMRTHDGFAYALVVCTALAAVIALFHAAHGWRGHTWLAIAATYGVFVYAFRSQPAALDWTPEAYRWGASVAMTICFAAFALACVAESRRNGPSARTLAIAGLANVCLYTYWMLGALAPDAPTWPLFAGVASALTLFAIAGETGPSRPHRASLTQVYAACAALLLTFALFGALSPAKTLPAFAALTLAVAIIGGLTRMPVLRVLGLIGTAAVFVMAIPEVSMPGRISLWGLTIPAKWFSALGVASLLCVGAWFQTHSPVPRFAAPWRGARVAAWCGSRRSAFAMAGAAALLTLTIIVFDIGEDPVLPFVLAFAGIVMAGIGLVTLTPAIELSALAILTGAHVTWHRFLSIDPSGFTRLEGFSMYSALLGIATGFAALLWERRLNAADEKRPLDHYAMAALPWVIVTALALRLAGFWFTEGYGPVALAIFGAALVATGFALHSVGAIVASVPAFGYAACLLALALHRDPGFLPESVGIAGYLLLALGPYSAAERLLHAFSHRRISRYGLDDLYRTALVATAGTLGLLALHMWSQSTWTLVWWGLHGLVGAALGFIFAETRYYWATGFVVAMIAIRIVLYDLNALPMPLRVLAMLTALGAALALAWWFVRYRAQQPHADVRG